MMQLLHTPFSLSISIGLYCLPSLVWTWSTTAFQNSKPPVIVSNFPDPALSRTDDGTWYAFATQNEKINIQLASSSDFASWHVHEGYDALPQLPSWAEKSPHAKVWGPDVTRRADGTWVMYYAALNKHHHLRHCIGAAISCDISGPFQPIERTLICDLTRGGNIDPNFFGDPANGNNYLVYKTDGNSIGHGGACNNSRRPLVPTPLYLQLLDPDDLVTPVGPPTFLVSNIGSFSGDGPNVERPSIVHRNGTYYLLYNAQCFTSLHYRIDYISCVSGQDTHMGIVGCDWAKLKTTQQKWRKRTLLKTGDIVSGTELHAPGSMDVSDGESKIVFHSDINQKWFKPHNSKSVERVRAMQAAEIDFDNDTGDLVVTKLY